MVELPKEGPIEKKDTRSVFSKSWTIFRWPAAIFLLAGGVFVFCIGLMGNFGYTGTTSLRSTKPDSSEWKALESATGGSTGSPIVWDGDLPQKQSDTIKFDSRLVNLLVYLSKVSSADCGSNKAHEYIALDATVDDDVSDLSYPTENLPSSSTISRGVGVRVTSLDRIKCTQVCTNEPPRTFNDPGYPISLKYSDLIEPEDFVQANCRVTCAVGYYPLAPVDALASDLVEPTYAGDISKYDPGIFDYSQIKEASRKAAVLKSAQLGYEILNVDQAGCYSDSVREGNERMIPTTMIFPQWVQGVLKDDWQKVFLTLASKRFPYNFQSDSPTAGLSYDPFLNNEGLHINY